MIKDYFDSFYSIITNAIVTEQDGTVIDLNKAYGFLINIFKKTKKENGTIFLIGNGGSSGIISHAAIDFLNMCKLKAYPLTDSSQITCFANDYGYENVFKIPLETMFKKDDSLFAVSSSGTSKNIVNAAQICKQIGGFVITFSGFKPDNPLRKIGDYNFWLNCSNYGKVEIGHALLLHFICNSYLEKNV